ncbi:MAG: UvrB/UvrC motif-containing protein, partial [Clostridiales bacterium]|nr:UvrB/UvrC motif-containing protein [Clostridiales bacterium]
RPEASRRATRDADKEGCLRSETSLIQTIGRAARNAEGKVILYADKITPSMANAMEETQRRREKQDAYNKAHGIVPKTIRKEIKDLLELSKAVDEDTARGSRTQEETEQTIAQLEKEMQEAAKRLEFELAAALRDQIITLRGEQPKQKGKSR